VPKSPTEETENAADEGPAGSLRPAMAAAAEPPKTETAIDLVLDDFSTLDTAVMQIVPPGLGRSLGSITFAGPSHPKTLRRDQMLFEKNKFEQHQQKLNPRWSPPQKTQQEEKEETAKNVVVSRIVGWDIKGRQADGAIVPVPYDDATALKMLLDPSKEWLYIDSIIFIGRVENFMPSSSPH
jgi:hypothetical protein